MKTAKKVLSVLLALSMIFSISVYAFAVEETDLYDIMKEIEASYAFVTADIEKFTLDDAVNYYYYTLATETAIEFYDDFKADVLANLEANDGKLVSSYGENITTYAAVLGIAVNCCDNPTEFGGYNLVELLANADKSTVSSPYYYNIVIPVASIYCDEEFTKNLCDDFVNNYYVMGEGMNNGGYTGCDDTAMFISAISQSYLEGYDEVLEDALKVLDTYKVDGGYCYNPIWGTEVSANSTALALMAESEYYIYCGIEENTIENLTAVYNDLMKLKGEEKGSFQGYNEISSTNDVLKALPSYAKITFINALVSTEIGDLNGDDKISVVDAKWVLQVVAGTRTLGFAQELAADVNGDGKVSVVDAKWILQIVAGTRESETIALG